VGETTLRYSASNPDWGTVDTKFILKSESDDDVELCQLTIVLVDYNRRVDEREPDENDAPAEDEDGAVKVPEVFEPFVLGVGSLDGEDLSCFLYSPISDIEELTLYDPASGATPRECGTVSIMSCRRK